MTSGISDRRKQRRQGAFSALPSDGQLFQCRLYFLRRELRGVGDGFAGRGVLRGLAGQDAERAKGLEDVYIRQRREPLRDAGKLFFGGLVPKPVKAGKQ